MGDAKARCEDCGLLYEVGTAGVPVTDYPYTCDDCSGYVDVVSAEEAAEAQAAHDATVERLRTWTSSPQAEGTLGGQT